MMKPEPRKDYWREQFLGEYYPGHSRETELIERSRLGLHPFDEELPDSDPNEDADRETDLPEDEPGGSQVREPRRTPPGAQPGGAEAIPEEAVIG